MTATVLIVDDIEQNVKLLEAKLLTEYYTVLTANHGEKALEVLAGPNKVDIVLLDVMMPVMDGFGTCKNIKSNPDTMHIPVVMVTALSDIEDRVKGLEAGADEFLTKPINDTALFTRVKSLSRVKGIIDELKLRNQTNSELGVSVVEIKDNFTNHKILLINDDLIQARNMSKIMFRLTPQITTITNMSELDSLRQYVPDLVVISCQLDEEDPLRICAMLKSRANYNHTVLMLFAEEENMPMVIKGMELGVHDYFVYPVDENELIARLKTQLRRKQYQDNLRNAVEQSVNLSVKDGLTGAFNRRYFDIYIQQMINKSAASLYLMMFDIDHFKMVNDTYGHLAGDAVLKYFVEILGKNFRITDLVARYGGEEFAVVINDVQPEDIKLIADRVRAAVEEAEFNVPGPDGNVIKKTTSIGVAKYKPNQSAEEFIKEADKALYKAKETGRNKVVYWE